MSTAKTRDKPLTRIDRFLYQEVCNEASIRGIEKTTMLESLVRVGLSMYRLGIACDLLIARFANSPVDQTVLIRKRPSTRIEAELYAEIGYELSQRTHMRKLHKTEFLEMCIRIGLANLRCLAEVNLQRVAQMPPSSMVA